MSIKLSDSPFRNMKKPCRFARESMNCIICSCKEANTTSCNLYHNSSCEWYSEADERLFVDNRVNSIEAIWMRVEDKNTYWYECSHCGSKPPHTEYNYEWKSRYCPCCGKYMYFEEENIKDVPAGIYQHFKGKYYEVLGVAEHSESSEKLVFYKALYGEYKLYARPLDMFVENIEDVHYNYRGPRFYQVKGFVNPKNEEPEY